MQEKEKMLKGMIYDGSDEELVNLRVRAHDLCLEYNNLKDRDPRRKEIIDELIPHGKGVFFQAPIHFDYGCFSKFGDFSYANFNLTVLDTCPVEVGDNVFIGANVSLMTPIHPFLPSERNAYLKEDGSYTDMEYAKPIKINNNCWISSGVIVCGGVEIGEGSVIGAGSVVTRSIPPHSFAAGNPCKVIRKITEKDSIYLKKELWPNEE